MTLNVFLSASVPDPARDARYYESADAIAIRDAVKALATVVLQRGTLVWGGHPSITPLIRLVRQALRIEGEDIGDVVLFQSEFFRHQLPSDNEAFERVRMVPAVDNDREESLAKMRNEMIRSVRFDAGAFIGGMEGVEEEYELFAELQPRALLMPVASTGGAALHLYDRLKDKKQLSEELATNLAYASLFRHLLGLSARNSGSPILPAE